MANVNLSLDEIIKTKKNPRVGGGRRNGGGGGGARRSVGGSGGRAGPSRHAGGGREKYFSDDVPSGKWKHDKFFEAYGGAGGGSKRRSGGGGGAGPVRGASGGARRARGGAEMVKLNISNLPDTVLTEDLDELFQDFQVYGVAVHYDESGAHLGTATLFVSPGTAKSIIREYANIAIDGQEIKIGIVDESGTLARGGRITDRIRRVGGGGGSPVRRRSGASGGGRRSAGGRVTKPSGGKGGKGPTLKKMTVEELDKELESYMGNRQGKE